MALNLVALGVALQNQGGGGSGGGSYSSFDNAAGGQTYKIKVGQELVMTDLVATENGVYDKPVVIEPPLLEIGATVTFKEYIDTIPQAFIDYIYDEYGWNIFIQIEQDETTYMLIRGDNGAFEGMIINHSPVSGDAVQRMYYNEFAANKYGKPGPGWYDLDDNQIAPPTISLVDQGEGMERYAFLVACATELLDGIAVPADGWHTVTVDLGGTGGDDLEASLSLGTTEIEEINLPNITSLRDCAFYMCKHNIKKINAPKLESIGTSCFSNFTNMSITEIPSAVKTIADYAFEKCNGLTSITFKGTPTSISTFAFFNCNNIKTINVPWAEGEVAGAPWGAANATINYNYTGE